MFDAGAREEAEAAAAKFLLARAMGREPRESQRVLELARSTLEVYRRFPTARVNKTREVESGLAAR